MDNVIEYASPAQPCPTCGTCPTCGKTPFYPLPVYPNTYPSGGTAAPMPIPAVIWN